MFGSSLKVLLARNFLVKRLISREMAHTKFEYVKSFELEDKLEPLQWILIQLQFANYREYTNLGVDKCLNASLQAVMTLSAEDVMSELREIDIGYGYCKSFSFVFQKHTTLYKRRGFKLLSSVSSLFSSAFVINYHKQFGKFPFKPPEFDGTIYLLPHDQCLRDFLTKEQYSCHLNNLEATTLYYLVDIAKLKYDDALSKAENSSESEKNEMLYSLCNINYNNEPVHYKKGAILLRKLDVQNSLCNNTKKKLFTLHEDFCKDRFWTEYFPLEEKTKLCSKFNYLKSFQRKNNILPHTFPVVRIDGKGFRKFSELHNFCKPNDSRSLKLMTASAQMVMQTYPKIKLSYGQSDEYSFVFARYCHKEKEGYSVISKVVSIFSGAFVSLWEYYFNDVNLVCKPAFDSRLVLYPSFTVIRDYLNWRQADCHINNLYNTCFWKLVQGKGLTRQEAQDYLKGTFSKDKLDILKNQFDLIYMTEDPLYRKGTTIFVDENNGKGEPSLSIKCIDIIGNKFWDENPTLLREKRESQSEIHSTTFSSLDS